MLPSAQNDISHWEVARASPPSGNLKTNLVKLTTGDKAPNAYCTLRD